MERKIALITGATSGIGKITAIELAKKGYHVIIHGRNTQKLEQVKTEILHICGHEFVDTLQGDVSSMQDVKAMAEKINNTYSKLDVLVNNAGGVMNAKRQITVDGLERTFAVNVLSVYMLSVLLLDKLKAAKQGRIVNISSMAHQFAKPVMSDLQLEKNYSSSRAYGNAKLFVIYLTKEMHRRMRDSGIQNITVNALHPGVVATRFAQESKGSLMNFFFNVFRLFFITPEKGAQTTIYLADSDEASHSSGEYFAKSKIAPIKKTYIQNQLMDDLWNACANLSGVKIL